MSENLRSKNTFKTVLAKSGAEKNSFLVLNLKQMKKRTNVFSPTGLSPTEKEQRRMQRAESMTSVASGTSMASGMSEATRKRLDREKAFENRGKGPMRNMVVVDILKCDGEAFKGTITPTDAKNIIYGDALNLDRLNLHGIKVEYKGNPVISYMLKEKINIDTTFTSVDFYFEKDTANGRSVFEGKIRGVRLEDTTPRENDVRWVKLENCAWAFKEEKVKEWLSLYGEMMSPLEEEEQRFDSDDSDECKDPVGNGNLATKMRLSKSIPQFLPMLGRKIRVYYRGITKLCINCYEPGHIRKDCPNQTVGWISYVERFMRENNLDDSFYGNWRKVVDNIKHKKEMEEQRKRLVEEVREMSGSPGVTPPPNAGEPEEGRSEGGGKKEKEGKETAGPRRSVRMDGKKGEKTRTLTQTRPEGNGLGESGNGEPKKGIATGIGLGKSLKEKAIAAKNRVDSQRKNSI